MNKKILGILIILVCCFSLFAKGNKDENTAKKISVVTTIFPEYDWVKNIIGNNDNIEVSLLLQNGTDLHSYQPTVDDIVKISTSDIFIYVGGESDEWVEDVLAEASNKNLVAINLLEVLGDSIKEEELVEGMQAEEHDHDHDADEHEHEHDEDEHDHEHEEVEYDEHVWLSLKSVEVLCKNISERLAQIDSVNAEVYNTNTTAYISKLAELDGKYQNVVDNAKNKTVLFGDRFPFRYLVDDYGIKYYAAFVGCSAETEASFETIAFLAKKVDELKLNSVLIIENGNDKIAKTIIQNTTNKNQTVLEMNSLQSVTSKEIANGVTYLSIMQENLSILEKALN